VPVAGQIMHDLGGGGAPRTAPVLTVTIWELGEAAGPLLIGPLSEAVGRYPVIAAGSAVSVAAAALAATSQSATAFVVLRAVAGAAVTSNVLNPAIVGDMFAPERRGTALTLPMFATLLGSTLGPALGGLITAVCGWRTVLWLSAGLASVCAIAFAFGFRETYVPVILRRRAAQRLGQDVDGPFLHVPAETVEESMEESKRIPTGIRSSILRPVTVLFGSGVLTALSLFSSIVYAQILVLATTLPEILERNYGLSMTGIGTVFLVNGKHGGLFPENHVQLGVF
jgi:MFS family permease